MILFRAVTSEELVNRLHHNNPNTRATIKGCNTFRYEEGVEYLHFFRYAEHAFYYKEEKRCVAVLECVIPDEIIEKYGFGFYGGVKTDKNNSLYGWYMPLPECIIKRENFRPEYIYSISDKWNGMFNSKILNNNDNEIYNEPMEKKLSLFNSRWDTTYDYKAFSYAEIYYEIVYKLLKENGFEMSEVTKILRNMDLNYEILSYFENNRDLLLKYVEEEKDKVQDKKKKNKELLKIFKKNELSSQEKEKKLIMDYVMRMKSIEKSFQGSSSKNRTLSLLKK